MKILCLHGYTQNGSLFARKASGLRKMMKKAGHEMVFIDGPYKVQLSELPFEASPELAQTDMRAWWLINEADPRYENTEEAFNTVKKAVDEHGPFDGLLAFSQGSGLAAILTKAIHQIAPSHPPFKFAILYSGFRLKAAADQHWYEKPFDTPSLHIMGTLDTVVSEERGMALYNCWNADKRSILKHPGGHYVPSQRPMLEPVISFLNNLEKEDEKKASGETAAEDDWSAFDSIGK